MKLAISNIAWDNCDSEIAYGLMRSYRFEGLEIAPTKIWTDPLSSSAAERTEFLLGIRNRGLQLVAMQSLFFNQPHIQLFGKSEKEFDQHLTGLIWLASELGIKSLVLGSPKNRAYLGISKKSAISLALDFFGSIGEKAAKLGVFVCIEPNPSEYGTNFMCTTRETLDFVKQIDSQGIKLHLDLGALIMNQEDLSIIEESIPYISHCHISEPYLEPITNRPEHLVVKKFLSEYDGYCSIEMKRAKFEDIEKSMKLVANLYG